MALDSRPRRRASDLESERERTQRVERLRRAIVAGRYFVPATEVARSLVRRLGLDWLELQHQ